MGTRKQVTCETFTSEQCTGTDKKNRKYTVSLGKNQKCTATCDKATCCAVEAEATCFPGEAEVSTEGGSSMVMTELQSDTVVLVGPHTEAVIGMLHLHSESTSTAVRATATSV